MFFLIGFCAGGFAVYSLIAMLFNHVFIEDSFEE